MASAVGGMNGERCSPANRSASQVWPRTRPRAAMSRLASSHGFWLSMYWLAASSKPQMASRARWKAKACMASATRASSASAVSRSRRSASVTGSPGAGMRPSR